MLKGKNSGIITMTIIAIVLLLIVLEIQPVPLITAFGQIPYLPDQHSSSENQDTPKTSASYPSQKLMLLPPILVEQMAELLVVL